MADIKNVDFGYILGIDADSGHNSGIDESRKTPFSTYSDDHKKRLATVAALELIRSSSNSFNDLYANIEQLSSFRDQILAALGENVK